MAKFQIFNICHVKKSEIPLYVVVEKIQTKTYIPDSKFLTKIMSQNLDSKSKIKIKTQGSDLNLELEILLTTLTLNNLRFGPSFAWGNFAPGNNIWVSYCPQLLIMIPGRC